MALKTLLGLLLILLCEAPQGRVEGATAASAQETPAPECACKAREVGRSGSRKAWTPYNQGIRWHLDSGESQKLARAADKLVFSFHVAGDLDKEGC